MFKRVLVANRGEIACRILSTCERMGIETVAVFSDADQTALHVSRADQALRLGAAPVKDSYLNIAALVHAIEATGADAVHPGYGLLSENAEFARAVAQTSATFIGPSEAALAVFGDKISARNLARSVGVEPPPGSDGPIDVEDATLLQEHAARIGFPLLVKAAGGGGGIGMQIVRNEADLARAAKTCSDRGRAAFGDERVYLERYLESPRHIEVQVLCDTHGNAVALGERECSVQRRHQKIIEESPSPASFFAGESGRARRAELWERALRVVKKAAYVGAGTVEFVADAAGNLYFLEVNARLQVEHPVSEARTGLDLVELQLRVAAGEELPEAVRVPSFMGHAIEARLYAEDPAKQFAPQPGRIARLIWPAADPSSGIRIDAGIAAGSEVTPFYDPLLAKIISHADTREEAISRLLAALATVEIELVGPKGPKATNLEFLQRVLRSAPFEAGQYDTSLAESLARG
jgi:acetyl-CoA carboxylase biotin carboxylase subunit/3-methylcrotonyl-CoA carboxylase alpha subunit